MHELNGAWSQKSVLITGGLGFLGSHLAMVLLEAGADVVLVDNDLRPDRLSLLPISNAKLDVVALDVCDKVGVDRLFELQTFDAVFHLAAYSVIELATRYPDMSISTNAIGTLNVTDAVHRLAGASTRLVLASTDKVYGEMAGDSYLETSPLRGVGMYDCGKLAADVIVRSYFHTFGTNVSILRLCNIFGPNDKNDGYRLVPRSLGRIFDPTGPVAPVLYAGSVGHWRDYVYVSDAVRALLTVGSHPLAVGEAFNMVAASHLSTPMFLECLVDASVAVLRGRDPDRAAVVAANGVRVENGERAALTIERQHLDSTKIMTQLGFANKTTFVDGVQRTVGHYAARFLSGLAHAN